MRKNGVPNFPDPDRDQRIQTTTSANRGILQKLGVSSARYRHAYRLCRGLQPGGASDSQISAEELQSLLRFARCVRAHGVPAFPDPAAGSTLQRMPPGLDTHSPAFLTAIQFCRTHVPG